MPPTLLAITGVPHVSDSRTTFGIPSGPAGQHQDAGGSIPLWQLFQRTRAEQMHDLLQSGPDDLIGQVLQQGALANQAATESCRAP